ncbi:MAG: SOS response-associated peptidase [Thermostichus sp. HHBFW_bins_43]
MCGRYSLAVAPDVLMQHFELSLEAEEATLAMLTPRYNIAPSQAVLAVVAPEPDGDPPRRRATHFQWGLIPSWNKAPKAGLINARSETVAEKPSFRTAFRRRRCLIPADGFYEWAMAMPPSSSGQDMGKQSKQPYWFHLREQPVFAFAGIWERWQSPEGTELETCAILNTTANRLMQPLHERMPVILAEPAYDRWLDPQVQDPNLLLPLLRPYPSEAMEAYPVSTHVNNPRHEDPACRDPIGDPLLASDS